MHGSQASLASKRGGFRGGRGGRGGNRDRPPRERRPSREDHQKSAHGKEKNQSQQQRKTSRDEEPKAQPSVYFSPLLFYVNDFRFPKQLRNPMSKMMSWSKRFLFLHRKLRPLQQLAQSMPKRRRRRRKRRRYDTSRITNSILSRTLPRTIRLLLAPTSFLCSLKNKVLFFSYSSSNVSFQVKHCCTFRESNSAFTLLVSSYSQVFPTTLLFPPVCYSALQLS